MGWDGMGWDGRGREGRHNYWTAYMVFSVILYSPLLHSLFNLLFPTE